MPTCLPPFSSSTFRQHCPPFPSPSSLLSLLTSLFGITLYINSSNPKHPSSSSFTLQNSESIIRSRAHNNIQNSSSNPRNKMGLCTSCDATAIATAKLILPDGKLQEFTHPIKAGYVSQRLKSPSFFICNSDEMEFNDVVSAMEDDEELQLGQLYFALPLGCLRRPLQASEMAELAVRASNALMKCGGGGGSNNGGGFGGAWAVMEEREVRSGARRERRSGRTVDGDGEGRRRRAAEGGGGRRRRRTMSVELSVIPE